MLTMLLGGLWHGAAWTFVIWGGIHGGALSAERWARERWAGFRMPAWLAWFVTFHVVCLAWVFFRSPDLSTAFAMLGGVFAGGPSPLVTLPDGLPDRGGDRPPGRARPASGSGPRAGSSPGRWPPRAWRSGC